MRAAAARAAIRRGSSMTMRCPSSQAGEAASRPPASASGTPASASGTPASASGTRVVLPAPGGATSTAFGVAARLSSSAGSMSATGRSGIAAAIAPV